MENKTPEDVKPDYHEEAVQHFAHINMEFDNEAEMHAIIFGFEEALQHKIVPLRSELTKLREENETINKKMEFYRSEMEKLRTYCDVNRIGVPNEKLLDAIYNHVTQLTSQLSKAKDLLKWVNDVYLGHVKNLAPYNGKNQIEQFLNDNP